MTNGYGDAGSGTAQKVWMFTPSGAADTGFATGGSLTANSGATVLGWAVASGGGTQRIVVAGSYGSQAAQAVFAPASVRLYAQQDANYNVTAMVDSNGNVVRRYIYDPYGNISVLGATWTPQSDLFNTQGYELHACRHLLQAVATGDYILVAAFRMMLS